MSFLTQKTLELYTHLVVHDTVKGSSSEVQRIDLQEDWKIWRVDFTRAFRLHKDLKDSRDLMRCDRQLFDKLKTLDGNELAARTKSCLTKDEVKAVTARRDNIVAQFEKLISEKGEKEVLY